MVRDADRQRGRDPGSGHRPAGEIAAKHGVWLVVGVEEREPNGATIYNTVLYFSPDGTLSTGTASSCPPVERTVWGMGDGSTLRAVDTRTAGSVG